MVLTNHGPCWFFWQPRRYGAASRSVACSWLSAGLINSSLPGGTPSQHRHRHLTCLCRPYVVSPLQPSRTLTITNPSSTIQLLLKCTNIAMKESSAPLFCMLYSCQLWQWEAVALVAKPWNVKLEVTLAGQSPHSPPCRISPYPLLPLKGSLHVALVLFCQFQKGNKVDIHWYRNWNHSCDEFLSLAPICKQFILS